MATQKSIAIYALADPRNHLVRYVGRTKNLAQRLRGHGSARSELRLKEWVGALRKRKLRPIYIVLQRVHREDASEAETTWIQSFSRQGLLLNLSQTPEAHGFVRYDLWVSRFLERRLGEESEKTGLPKMTVLCRTVDSGLRTPHRRAES